MGLCVEYVAGYGVHRSQDCSSCRTGSASLKLTRPMSLHCYRHSRAVTFASTLLNGCDARCVQRTLKQECLGFYEMSCAGICNSETRLVPLYKDCVLDQGSAAAAIIKDALGRQKREALSEYLNAHILQPAIVIYSN